MISAERATHLAIRNILARAVEEIDAALAANPADPLDMVPLAEAARAWGCSKEAARQRAKRARIGIKVGGRWRVPRATVVNGGKIDAEA